MKRILLTVFQLAVTALLLWWVFHDPDQLKKMKEALQSADYRWVGGGILAYIIVEIAAAIRWQILLRVQQIRLSFARVSASFSPIAVRLTTVRLAVEPTQRRG